MPVPERWEHGSEFHLLSEWVAAPEATPWKSGDNFYGSGRDAMRALIEHGQKARGWQRLWIPSYYCQEVVAALASTGLTLQVYRAGPVETECDHTGIAVEPGDAVLLLNFFGLGSAGQLAGLQSRGAEVIEDHTHDPISAWAFGSHADWCLASLRKVFPVPDGGVLWSPKGYALPLPVPATEERSIASVRKLTAMWLKGEYLAGRSVAKESFRLLAMAGEQGIALGSVSGMTQVSLDLLRSFPIRDWRSRKIRNFATLSRRLSKVPWLTVLMPSTEEGTCPFSALLVFDDQQRRDHTRRRLIDSNVYPAILWSLEEPVHRFVPAEHLSLSRRILSIHCDMRYSETDMERVASLIMEFGWEDDKGGAF